MTPQERAAKLVDKFLEIQTGYDFYTTKLSYAKQCALIAVDEIISVQVVNPTYREFWKEVKQEIEKL